MSFHVKNMSMNLLVISYVFQSNIAAGIMPVTGLVAAARKTPPPGPADSARDINLGLSHGTGVLNSSMLGRMFRTVSPGEIIQDNTEDTDTSLNDYETAQGTMPPYVQK